MWKPASQSRPSRSLPLGAALLSMLVSLGACATVDSGQRGFAGASAAEPSPRARSGFAAIEESPRSTRWGYTNVSESPQPEIWGFVRLPAESRRTAQASRVSAPASAQR